MCECVYMCEYACHTAHKNLKGYFARSRGWLLRRCLSNYVHVCMVIDVGEMVVVRVIQVASEVG